MNYNRPHVDVRESVAFPSFKFSHSARLPWTISYRAIPAVAMICDGLLIISASIVAGAVYDYYSIVGRPSFLLQCLGLAALVAALFITLAKSRNLYDPTELLNFKSQIRKLSVKWVGVLLFLAAAGFAMKAGGDFSRGATLLFAGFGLAAILDRAIGLAFGSRRRIGRSQILGAADRPDCWRRARRPRQVSSRCSHDTDCNLSISLSCLRTRATFAHEKG